MLDSKKLKRYIALKIKVDFNTDERADGVNSRDFSLVCFGW